MGRFYRTSGSNPLDYMYKLDVPLMTKAIETNDQYIDSEIGGLAKIGEYAKFNHTTGDADKANGIISDYEGKVNDLTSSILKDPANWRDKLGSIRDLSQNLQDNFMNGDISKMVSNYNGQKTYEDNIDKQVDLWYKTGGVDKNGNSVGISPDKAQLYKAYSRNGFSGTFNPDGTNNVFQGIAAMPTMDYRSLVDKTASEVKKDKTANFTSSDGIVGADGKMKSPYFNDVSHEWEGVSPDKILGAAYNRLQSSDIMNNLVNASKIGYVKGVFRDQDDPNGAYKKGDFIKPFDYLDNSKPTPEEQSRIDAAQLKINQLKKTNPTQAAAQQEGLDKEVNQLKGRQKLQWNNDSFLSPILQGVIGKYSTSESTDKQNLRNNSYANTELTQRMENYRQIVGGQIALNLEGVKAKNESALENQKSTNRINETQAKIDAETIAKGDNGGKDANGKPIPNYIPTNQGGQFIVDGSATNAKSNTQEKVVSSLKDGIAASKAEIAALNAKLSTTTDDEEKKAIQANLERVTATRDNNVNRLQRATEDAKKELFKGVGNSEFDELSNYNKNTQEYKQVLAQIRQAAPNTDNPRLIRPNSFNSPLSTGLAKDPNEVHLTQEQADILDRQKRMDANLTKMTNLRDKNIFSAEQSNTQSMPWFKVSTPTANSIKQGILVDGSKYHLMDTRGNPVDLTFEQYNGTKKNEHFLGPDDINKMQIKASAPSAGGNYGDDVNLAVSINGERYILVPNDGGATKQRVVNEWAKSKDPLATKLAGRLDNGIFNAVSSALKEPIQSTGNIAPAINTVIPLNDGTQATVHITPHKTGNDWTKPYYSVEVLTDGKWETLNKNFTSDADITDDLNKVYPVKTEKK